MALQRGDKVEWNSSAGKTRGTIKQKITSEAQIKRHKVRATNDAPQFEVKSDKSGSTAAHKPKSLKKI